MTAKERERERRAFILAPDDRRDLWPAAYGSDALADDASELSSLPPMLMMIQSEQFSATNDCGKMLTSK